MINLKKIHEYIDKIGIEEALKKIDSYDVIGPTAVETFGEQAVQQLEKEIISL